MQIDHLGIAVRSVEAAADRLATVLGYERKTTKVHNTRQRVNVLFLQKAGSLDLKLIEPADDQSPLVDFVRKGGGLHHLCFKVPDVSQACTTLSGSAHASWRRRRPARRSTIIRSRSCMSAAV